MAINKKIHVHDGPSLLLEKQRLMALCELKEEKLKMHFDDFKNHYPEMAMNSILPFEKETNHNISSVLDFLNENIFSSLLGISFNKSADDWKKNMIKLAQSVIIAWSYRLFKKIFSRNKKAQTE